MVTHTCNSSTQEVEAAGSGIQGHPWLHSEFESSLGYVKLCLKNKKGAVVSEGAPQEPFRRISFIALSQLELSFSFCYTEREELIARAQSL